MKHILKPEKKLKYCTFIPALFILNGIVIAYINHIPELNIPASLKLPEWK
jgi:hypothetical protein